MLQDNLDTPEGRQTLHRVKSFADPSIFTNANLISHPNDGALEVIGVLVTSKEPSTSVRSEPFTTDAHRHAVG